MESTSPQFKLDTVDGLKIAKGLGIALAGTTLAYFADVLHIIDFGELKPFAVIFLPVLMAGINAGLKWVKDNSSSV